MSAPSGITVDSSSGLGIDLFPEEFNNSGSKSVPISAPSNGVRASHDHTQPTRHGERDDTSSCSNSNRSRTSTTLLPSILGLSSESSSGSSARTMRLTSGANSTNHPNCNSNVYMGVLSKKQYPTGTSALSRTGTLLTIDGTIENAEELKQILGNVNSRLKFGATLTPGPVSDTSAFRTRRARTISLEQARSRSRIILDIFLESDVCVQGGSMQGYIQIRVRKYIKSNRPILISGGELRLIGFESTGNDRERAIFYQCSASLSEVAHGLERLYSSEPDEEGFSASIEGIHLFPFVLHLTPDSEKGTAKGTFNSQNGPSIRYIAMISLALKDSASGKQSIAHFYRDCNIWPRLNPSTVLAPTSRPIRVTASGSSHMGGNGEVKLTASLHRLHWVSGQSCFVGVKIANNSEKVVKNLSLRLICSTTLFRVGYKFDVAGNHQRKTTITDELQSSTIMKEVARSNLEVCGRGTRGHASAKGWWAGVIPCQTRSFSHHILIPQDAVSISRGSLVEVSYTLQITVNVGTILATEVQVSLPVEIINFLSIDPPPQFIPDSINANWPSDSTSESPSYSDEDGHEDPGDEDEGYSSGDDSLDYPNEPTALDIVAARPAADQNENHVGFADLYYSSLEDNLDKQAEQFRAKQHQDPSVGVLLASESHSSNPKNTFAVRVKEKSLLRQAAVAGNHLSLPGLRDRHPTGINQSSDQCKCGQTEAEASLLPESSTLSEPSSRLPASDTKEMIVDTQGNDSSSVKNDQEPCFCAANPNMSFSPKMSHDGSTSSHSQLAARRHVSGVGLLEDHSQSSHWNMPTISRPEDLSQPSVRKPLTRAPNYPCNDSLGKPSSTLQQSQPMVASKSSTQGVDIPKSISSPSAPPIGSVKDKIRGLEELASKTIDGA